MDALGQTFEALDLLGAFLQMRGASKQLCLLDGSCVFSARPDLSLQPVQLDAQLVETLEQGFKLPKQKPRHKSATR